MHHNLPLNSLNTFAAAAERLSFQEAAEALHVTPSAVSHQVRGLEKLLDYRLFDRLDRGVRLTSRGEQLFADIRAPLRQLHEAGRRALRGRDDNTLTLSVAPVFATGWLLPRLKDFYARHPEISLSVVATTDLADFDSDPFDASIRMGSGDWEKTVAYRLFNMELVAVSHPALIVARKRRLSPAEVAIGPLVSNASMPGTWDAWFRSADVEEPAGTGFRLEVQNAAQVVEAVQPGDTIGLVDRKLIRPDIESGRLAIACDHVLESEGGYFLACPAQGEELPSLQHFRDWILGHLTADDPT